jgi:hypothetical protein
MYQSLQGGARLAIYGMYFSAHEPLPAAVRGNRCAIHVFLAEGASRVPYKKGTSCYVRREVGWQVRISHPILVRFY